MIDLSAVKNENQEEMTVSEVQEKLNEIINDFCYKISNMLDEIKESNICKQLTEEQNMIGDSLLELNRIMYKIDSKLDK